MKQQIKPNTINPVDVIEEVAPYVFPGFEVNEESFEKAKQELNEEVKNDSTD